MRWFLNVKWLKNSKFLFILRYTVIMLQSYSVSTDIFLHNYDIFSLKNIYLTFVWVTYLKTNINTLLYLLKHSKNMFEKVALITVTTNFERKRWGRLSWGNQKSIWWQKKVGVKREAWMQLKHIFLDGCWILDMALNAPNYK